MFVDLHPGAVVELLPDPHVQGSAGRCQDRPVGGRLLNAIANANPILPGIQ
jgi:hypothetical protein